MVSLLSQEYAWDIRTWTDSNSTQVNTFNHYLNASKNYFTIQQSKQQMTERRYEWFMKRATLSMVQPGLSVHIFLCDLTKIVFFKKDKTFLFVCGKTLDYEKLHKQFFVRRECCVLFLWITSSIFQLDLHFFIIYKKLQKNSLFTKTWRCVCSVFHVDMLKTILLENKRKVDIFAKLKKPFLVDLVRVSQTKTNKN